MRLALGISYLGANYAGLQKISRGASIAGTLEAALAEVANHPVHLYAAGRTDKGVHALQQVMHFDTQSARAAYKWCDGANAHLPDDIRLLWIRDVASDFHARFSAHSRRYAYLIYNGRDPGAAMHRLCYPHFKPLNAQAMRQACVNLGGEYDCVAFTTTGSKSLTNIRHIDWIRVYHNSPWLLVDMQANAFVHRMVRMLVAELLRIGEELLPTEHLGGLLKSGAQRPHKIVAPAKGLYLTSIGYSPSWALPLKPVEELWPYRLINNPVETHL